MQDQLEGKTTPTHGPESQVALKQRGWWTSNPKPPGGVGGRKTEKQQGLLGLPLLCRPRSRDVPP